MPPRPRMPINLVKGHPNPSLLPSQALISAASTALSNPAIATPALLYGADEGYFPLREAIARWNTAFYAPRARDVRPEEVVITGGASQNLACVLQVASDPLYTQRVWIFSPAYMLVFRVFADNGFADKMVAVPETATDGPDVEWLARAMEAFDDAQQETTVSIIPSPTTLLSSGPHLKALRPENKHYRHLIYCVPTFSNPSSTLMPLSARQSLVRLARKHDALIISDDVYDHLAWPSTLDPASLHRPITTALIPRLSDIDASLDGGVLRDGADGFGNALSNGSFSKICGPGMRCGWAEGAAKLVYAISQCGTTKSGGAPSQLVSALACELLTSGWLQGHIAGTLQREYAERWRTLRAAADEHLVRPLGCSVVQPGSHMGGYFMWVRLPAGVDADALVARAGEEQALVVISGSQFEVPCDEPLGHNDHVRLCFAWEDKELLEEGVRRLGLVLKGMVEGDA